ncbi:T9SS type A sorting domain-containing protein [Flavobacterium sp.]|uniref:DUF7619 domain-containing protein n=1 Tax=Flavobacterium sp. TaxID=239 RepID=UPI003752B7B7
MKKIYTLTFLFLISFSSFGQIVANDDGPITVSSSTTTTTNINVLTNDTLNGASINTSQINLTMIVSSHPNIILNNNGTLSISSGISAGTYNLTYQICQISNPTNCEIAIVTVIVTNASFIVTCEDIYIDSSSPPGANPGDTVVYNYTITNTSSASTATLSNIQGTSNIQGNIETLSGGPITLIQGESNSTSFTNTYTFSQADIDQGFVSNYSNFAATDVDGNTIYASTTDPTPYVITFLNCPTCTNVLIAQQPSVYLQMDGEYIDSNNNGSVDINDTIRYTSIAINGGNVTLYSSSISYSNISLINNVSSINVGQYSAPIISNYQLTNQDILNGYVYNFATINATSTSGQNVTDDSTDPTPCGSCPPNPSNPNSYYSYTIVKLPPLALQINGNYQDYNADSYVSVGDIIQYSYLINNADLNYSIDNISMIVTNATLSGNSISLPPQNLNNTNFTGLHIITQEDVNNGSVTTSATATGTINSENISVNNEKIVFLNVSDGIKLNAFIDVNSNGLQDGLEQNVAFGYFEYQINGGVTHNIYTSGGNHTIYESNPTNIYSLNFYCSNYSIAIPSYTNVSVSINSGITTYNFALTPVTILQDLAILLYSTSELPNPGFSHTNRLSYKNQGTQTIISGTITFNKNNVVNITNVSQTGITSSSNGFTFNFTNLLPNEQRFIDVTMLVPTIPIVTLGQQITNNASGTIASSELNISNNSRSLTQTIVGSYDPNDKTESHGGQILHSTFSASDYLNYTIRFENTGTANAINIRVNDVLDAKLDETSIRMVDASNTYFLERVGNVLNWRFNGINLPPSQPNTQIGHGYISFQIKPKPDYAVGDIIPNYADIFFDFNPAIVTDTCYTEFVAALNNPNFNFNNFNYYPNPVKNSFTISNDKTINEIEISSILGQKMIAKKVNDLQTELDLSEFSNGVYFVKVTCDGQEKTVKIVKE